VNLTFTLQGTEQLRDALAKFGDQAPQAAARALYQEGETIMTASKKLVPVETGSLRASGAVYGPEIEGSRVTVTLGYGNTSVRYAVIVHERLGVHHPVGQAKFLESVALQAVAGMEERLAVRVRKELSGLAG
jgi:hypothetical protein